MKVSGLGHFALGQSVPSKRHAVCVSLPTVEDLIGYEEKKSDTLAAISSGYPRFVRHSKIHELSEYWKTLDQAPDSDNFFFPNLSDLHFAKESCDISNDDIYEYESYHRLRLPKFSEDSKKLQKFHQHAGFGLSSRHAESILNSMGLCLDVEQVSDNPNAEKEIKTVIAQAHGQGITSKDVVLTSSGANAFTSAFRAALEVTRQKGKCIWIRLGWLYLDTIEIMDWLTLENENIISLNHPSEFNQLDDLFSKYGQNIAGVITEFPSNPLLHCCELEKVSQLCSEHDALLLVDPTMASPKNAKVTTYCDIVINSLTKYANWEGDVMMGSIVFPPSSNKGLEIKEITQNHVCPPFQKDLERLGEQIPFYNSFIERTNLSQIEIVNFLKSHPKVENVYYAYQESTGSHYRKIAGDEKPGCVISFEVNGNFKDFYNSLAMLKSPSFGTEFTLLCPYIYLAHYDKLTSHKGREALKMAGLSPELCRLSVGLEDPEMIKEVLSEALAKA